MGDLGMSNITTIVGADGREYEEYRNKHGKLVATVIKDKGTPPEVPLDPMAALEARLAAIEATLLEVESIMKK
jgi:hypothetical protein